MSEKNYWTSLRQRKISRRTMLRASGRAGVGAAGLALVGCGDDDDDDDAGAASDAAAEAARAAGDESAAAVAEAAAAAAEAAADAAREAGADQAEAAAEAAAAAAAAAEDAAQAAREAADAAAAGDEEEQAVATGEVDFDATLRLAVAADNGGLDPIRSGSQVNYINSHGVFNRSVEVDTETGSPVGILLQWELPDEVTWNFTVEDNVF